MWQWFTTFYSHNLQKFLISYSVCPWQAFPAKCIACVRLTIIRLGSKGLPLTNTLAYYEHV
jgi:hypothetical protein